MSTVLPRQYGNNNNNNYYNCDTYGYYADSYGNCNYSSWAAFGRWILLAATLVGFVFLYLLFSCITAPRRRAAGVQPYRFTQWAAGPPAYSQHVPQGYPQVNVMMPPPGYGGGVPPPQQQQTGPYHGTFASPQPAPYGQQQGYFGGQQTGIELQTPQPAYGTPETKGDGVAR